MTKTVKKKTHGISRKTILMVASALLTIGSAVARNSGIDVSYEALYGALMPVILFIFGQGKLEQNMSRAAIRQKNETRYRAPEFWVTVAGVLFPLLNDLLKLEIPVDTIPTVFTGLLTLIFGGKYTGLKHVTSGNRNSRK